MWSLSQCGKGGIPRIGMTERVTGGHIENNELPQEALVREFKEEIGIDIDVLDSGLPQAFSKIEIWEPQPKPFYIDYEITNKQGYDHNMYIEFYFVRRKDKSQQIRKLDIVDFKWFSKEEINSLDTYKQVIALSLFALKNHPDVI